MTEWIQGTCDDLWAWINSGNCFLGQESQVAGPLIKDKVGTVTETGSRAKASIRMSDHRGLWCFQKDHSCPSS